MHIHDHLRYDKNKHIELKITASFGAAILMENESLDDLLKRADATLYKAKNSCRNRVVTAS